MCREPTVQEALLWQNPTLVRTTLAGFLDADPGDTRKKMRRRARTFGKYVYRYATKNDTISFFGPIGYGVLGNAFRFEHGPQLVKQRRVFFEDWAIDALAAALSEDIEIKRWVPPRKPGLIDISGLRLPAEVESLWHRCDGQTSPSDLKSSEVLEEDDVLELLDELEEHGLIRWRLEVMPFLPASEQALAEQLDHFPDTPAVRSARASVHRLCDQKTRVASAANDPEALDRELRCLDDLFTDITGRAAQRRAGELYAGRTLVYEDCVRDLVLELGSDFTTRLGPPLTPLLLSARWLTHRVAHDHMRLFEDAFDRLQGDGAPVRYLDVWEAVSGAFPTEGSGAELMVAAQREFQLRWSNILRLDMGQPVQRLDVPDVLSHVHREFAAPHPGWPSARFHSADVQIAASDVAAFEAGRFQLILGELHVARNTLFPQPAVFQHPNPETLFAAANADLEGVSIPAPLGPTAMRGRSHYVPYDPEAPHIELSGQSPHPVDRVFRAADLHVERVDGRLMVGDERRPCAFDLMACIEESLTSQPEVYNFELLARAEHTPRVLLGEMVVARESWVMASNDVQFFRLPTPDRRLAAARELRGRLGLPRRVFVSVSGERKPFFVDFESSLSIEILSHSLRTTEEVRMTEMLPDLDQLWLADANDDRYTSELRIVLVDPVPWRPNR